MKPNSTNISDGFVFDSIDSSCHGINTKRTILPLAKDICTEAGLVSQQSLSLLRLIVSTTSFSSLANVFFPNNDQNDSEPYIPGLLSNAIASALVISPSDETRKLALNTFQSIFFILTSNHKAGGPFKNSLAIELLSIVTDLIPLGKDNEFMERCSHLFDVICDLLANVWNNASDSDKKKVIVIVDGEFKGIALDESKGCYSADVDIGPPPPKFTGIECIGKLLNWVCFSIIMAPVREQRRKKYPVDSFLVGLLKLADQIIELCGKRVKEKFGRNSAVFIRHLYFQCLFSLPSASDNGPLSAPKCKTSESRDSALTVLKTLCEHCPMNIEVIVRLLLSSHHSYQSSTPRTDLANEWHFDPLSRDKGSTGHVGLKNLGATCYLNSLLQQFFLIRPLRNGVLSCKTDVHFNTRDSDCNLLHQLQLLFANLLLSERRDYDTSELCMSIKGYDGSPIRPGEQQDVVEFFNLFGDRLETTLKSLDQRFLLQDIFGGELCHVIICQECKHRSERSEDCLSLSLDVKGKSNITESLKLYIQGEALDGDNQYYCEKCQAKRDSLKMCCVSSLPNNLILHLKRFEFDLELMRKIKVNDRFEYPLELNMLPFTKEGQSTAALGSNSLHMSGNRDNYQEGVDMSDAPMIHPDSYYQYSLRGVLVHSGTADSGHYYSLARDKSHEIGDLTKNNNWMNSQGVSQVPWYCFNDSCVTPFDPSSLPSATFGGIKVGTKYDHLAQKMVRTETPKPYSAYLLIYERNHIEFKTRMDLPNTDGQSIPDGIDRPSLDNGSMSSKLDLDQRWHPQFDQPELDLGQNVPPTIFNTLWAENDRFLRDQVIFSPEYCKWLLSMSKMPVSNSLTKKNQSTYMTLEMIQVMTHFLFETLIHGKDRRNHCELVTSLLCNGYAESEDACRWILETMSTKTKYWVEKILLNCPVIDVRKDFVKLLSVIFRKMVPLERKLYHVEISEQSKEEDTDLDNSSNSESRSQSDTVYIDDTEEDIHDTDDDIILTSTETPSIGNKALNSTRLGRAKWWRSTSILARFVGSALLDLLPDCESHWRRFDQLFESIYVFASFGQDESLYLIRYVYRIQQSRHCVKFGYIESFLICR